MKQLKLIKPQKSDHGGTLRSSRKGRGMRQIATNSTMHFVLRSTRATGKMSFNKNRTKWLPIVRKFAARYGVKIVSHADPGNHIHLHLRFANRRTYRPFIRAITSAIAMAITGASRWKKVDFKFWDLRPFSRIVVGRRAFSVMQDYLLINELTARGVSRKEAEVGVRHRREYRTAAS